MGTCVITDRMFSLGMSTENEALPPAIQQLLAIFTSELSDVRFGDLDRETLESAARTVTLAAVAVSEAEAVVAAARTDLAQVQEALLQKGQRALAHARIHALEHPALAERLQTISFDRLFDRGGRVAETGLGAGTSPVVRRRGRPSKPAGGGGTLLLETDATALPSSRSVDLEDAPSAASSS